MIRYEVYGWFYSALTKSEHRFVVMVDANNSDDAKSKADLYIWAEMPGVRRVMRLNAHPIERTN